MRCGTCCAIHGLEKGSRAACLQPNWPYSAANASEIYQRKSIRYIQGKYMCHVRRVAGIEHDVTHATFPMLAATVSKLSSKQSFLLAGVF
jgi:hypothetical protein